MKKLLIVFSLFFFSQSATQATYRRSKKRRKISQVKVFLRKEMLGTDSPNDDYLMLNVPNFCKAEKVIEKAIKHFKDENIQDEPCDSMMLNTLGNFLSSGHVFVLVDHTKLKASIQSKQASELLNNPIGTLTKAFSGVKVEEIRFDSDLFVDSMCDYNSKVCKEHEYMLYHVNPWFLTLRFKKLYIPQSVYVKNMDNSPPPPIYQHSTKRHLNNDNQIRHDLSTGIIIVALALIGVYYLFSRSKKESPSTQASSKAKEEQKNLKIEKQYPKPWLKRRAMHV